MQLRGRGDDGIELGGADKGVDVVFALFVIPGDLHHIFAIECAKIGIGVGEFAAHGLGVLDVHAKHDGLREAVAAFKKFGDLLGDKSAALFDDEVLVEVGSVIDAVFDGVGHLSVKPAGGRHPSASMSRVTFTTL
jgi:hypothetical protein